MLSNKPRPVGKFISSSGDGSTITITIALKSKILSPISLNSYQSEKVGLGIVAALENSIRSGPIPVNGGNNSGGEIEEMEMEMEMEEYTYVTCHGPEESYTRVYCDGGISTGDGGFDRRSGARRQSVCLFDISPARFGEVTAAPATSDFLSFCHLCRKKLDGKDIYMYRGEKAFCSRECRYNQMSMDERKAKWSSTTTSKSPHISSSSPYTNNNNGQVFYPGTLAI